MNDPVKTHLTEAEEALNIKAMVQEALADVCTAMDYAMKQGFRVSFNINLGPIGRNIVTNLTISKDY